MFSQSVFISENTETQNDKNDDNYNYQLIQDIFVHSKQDFYNKSEMLQFNEVRTITLQTKDKFLNTHTHLTHQ